MSHGDSINYRPDLKQFILELIIMIYENIPIFRIKALANEDII